MTVPLLLTDAAAATARCPWLESVASGNQLFPPGCISFRSNRSVSVSGSRKQNQLTESAVFSEVKPASKATAWFKTSGTVTLG